jgi:cephalosporin-C deacetylase
MADVSNHHKPDDFDEYWNKVDEELAQFALYPELKHSVRHSTDFAQAYDVRLTSSGPYRVFGYYSVPEGPGPFPALLYTPRYGSVNNPPHYDDRRRFVVLTIMHRGQRLADEPFQAVYPGLLTLDIDRANSYIYRAIVADCLRAAEWLQSRLEVDARRVGVVGDDLAVITAARRPQFAALHVTGLMFYRMMEARKRTSEYPIEEINDFLRIYPAQEEAVAETLSYFEPVHHASRINARTLISVSDPGKLGGPEWIQPLTAAIGSRAEHYMVTHEGGTDRDAVDSWISRELGVPAAPRLWEAAR